MEIESPFWRLIHAKIKEFIGYELSFDPITVLLGYINDGHVIQKENPEFISSSTSGHYTAIEETRTST